MLTWLWLFCVLPWEATGEHSWIARESFVFFCPPSSPYSSGGSVIITVVTMDLFYYYTFVRYPYRRD